MSDALKEAVAFTLRWEGGDSDDPADRGGRTRFGISQVAHPHVEVATLTKDEAIEIYKREYWDAIQGDRLGGPLGMVTFDAAVMHGPGTAVRFLQRALGAKDDGVIGSKTMLAIYALDFTHPTAFKALAERGRFIAKIVAADPSQSRFLGGWVSRLIDLAQYV
jgi:lysozyme family protein